MSSNQEKKQEVTESTVSSQKENSSTSLPSTENDKTEQLEDKSEEIECHNKPIHREKGRDPYELDLTDLVTKIRNAGHGKHLPFDAVFSSWGGHLLPSREDIIEVVEQLLMVIFPGYFGKTEVSPQSIPFFMGTTLDQISRRLEEQIKRGLCFMTECDECQERECSAKAKEITYKFMKRLPHVRSLLCTDVYAGYIGDPAATSTHEVIFCYPGLFAIAYQRLAHELYLLDVPIIPRIITEKAHSLTGIDIHPGASIGESFFIDHGTGVVIGETATIGKRVRIYQGVTLGAKSFPLDENGNPIKGILRHPQLGDDVIIYSGATVLGNVSIGSGSVIGGNVWITQDVPAHSKITLPSHKIDFVDESENS